MSYQDHYSTDYVVYITVPTCDKDGWEGADYLPTIGVYACTRKDLDGKMKAILKHLPEGATYYAVAI
jgi:hypothetical protein